MTLETGVLDRAAAQMDGWKEVPIQECGEPLEQLEPGERVLVHRIYASRGYPEAGAAIRFRSGVITRLRRAAAELPYGLALLVWDGWRSLALQQRLYAEYRAQLAATSRRSGQELDELVQLFVSIPSTDPLRPSPHLTGGAVDLTLATADGTPLDMGGTFDELTPRSATAFYPVTAAFGERRQLLRNVMESAEFTNFPSEWWHYDFGDQFWGRLTGSRAIYGMAGNDTI